MINVSKRKLVHCVANAYYDDWFLKYFNNSLRIFGLCLLVNNNKKTWIHIPIKTDKTAEIYIVYMFS